MSTYGKVTINNEYQGTILMIKNPKPIGERIHAVQYPTTNCQPDEYPRLEWEYLFIQVYDMDEDEKVTSVIIDSLEYSEPVEYETDLEIINSVYDSYDNCHLIKAK